MAGHWILLALLAVCSLSVSQECNRELLKDVDFPGTDITFVYSPDVEHCRMLCTEHFACQFFTFIRADWTSDNRHFYCYLKKTPTGTPNSQSPLVGVTSGYSLKPCNISPSPCLWKVYQNIDFPGADYKTFFTGDYEECQRACTHDPGCQFFTFVNENFTTHVNIRFKCHLKFSWSIPRPSNIERRHGLVSGFAQRTSPVDPDCKIKFLPNSAIPGSDLLVLPAASAGHCQSLCSAHPTCASFSWVSSSFICQLKKNGDYMRFVAKDRITSGLPTRFCHPENGWMKTQFEGLDFQGSDIRFELVDDAVTCQKTCSADPHCQYYTYVTEDFADSDHWRRCYLKRDITMPAPPKVAELQNVVSGFSRRNCDVV